MLDYDEVIKSSDPYYNYPSKLIEEKESNKM